MSFNPKFIISTKINKSLVEIERVRGFLDAIKIKGEWISFLHTWAADPVTEPSPLEVPHLMREFAGWLNRNEELSSVLLAGIAQFQFVHIHPFLDGNGRTARLLSTLILYKTGYDLLA